MSPSGLEGPGEGGLWLPDVPRTGDAVGGAHRLVDLAARVRRPVAIDNLPSMRSGMAAVGVPAAMKVRMILSYPIIWAMGFLIGARIPHSRFMIVGG